MTTPATTAHAAEAVAYLEAARKAAVAARAPDMHALLIEAVRVQAGHYTWGDPLDAEALCAWFVEWRERVGEVLAIENEDVLLRVVPR